jgi:hypothetical protein
MAGPDVALNLIIGLPFIKVTGVIADFVDNLCEAKHLMCDPFHINFHCTTKSIPVCGDCNAASHSIKFQEVFKALGSIKVYISCLPGTSPLGHSVPPSTHTAIKDEHPKRISFGFEH